LSTSTLHKDGARKSLDAPRAQLNSLAEKSPATSEGQASLARSADVFVKSAERRAAEHNSSGDFDAEDQWRTFAGSAKMVRESAQAYVAPAATSSSPTSHIPVEAGGHSLSEALTAPSRVAGQQSEAPVTPPRVEAGGNSTVEMYTQGHTPPRER